MASGRFETLGEILTRDNLLSPLLRRCMEGRALRAVGPATEEVPTSDGGSRTVITLSGAVAQEVDPPRWPREVCHVSSLFMCALFNQITSLLFLLPPISFSMIIRLHYSRLHHSMKLGSKHAFPNWLPTVSLTSICAAAA